MPEEICNKKTSKTTKNLQADGKIPKYLENGRDIFFRYLNKKRFCNTYVLWSCLRQLVFKHWVLHCILFVLSKYRKHFEIPQFFFKLLKRMFEKSLELCTPQPHCKLQFIPCTWPTFNQLEQAVQYKFRFYKRQNLYLSIELSPPKTVSSAETNLSPFANIVIPQFISWFY